MMSVTFLRAINVGGHVVKMDRLKELFAELGLKKVKSLIASGNILFAHEKGKAESLEKKIEAHLEKNLGYAVSTFIRTQEECTELVRIAAPLEKKLSPPGLLYLSFLKEDLTDEQKNKLKTLETEHDELIAGPKCFWWLAKRKVSEGKLGNALFEKALGVSMTIRNINTLRKAVQMEA
jgi:uncharacterized protein (DUF1697 family)